jgi:hypothetical protein
MYGKRQMLPNPTAEPAAAIIKPNFEPHWPLLSVETLIAYFLGLVNTSEAANFQKKIN